MVVRKCEVRNLMPLQDQAGRFTYSWNRAFSPLRTPAVTGPDCGGSLFRIGHNETWIFGDYSDLREAPLWLLDLQWKAQAAAQAPALASPSG